MLSKWASVILSHMNLTTDIPLGLTRNPWVKIVEFLQQNWAVVIERDEDVLIIFYGDTCGVFDEMALGTRAEAEDALRRNGFIPFSEMHDGENFLSVPQGKFFEAGHPNGRIYSSGRYWA